MTVSLRFDSSTFTIARWLALIELYGASLCLFALLQQLLRPECY